MTLIIKRNYNRKTSIRTNNKKIKTSPIQTKIGKIINGDDFSFTKKDRENHTHNAAFVEHSQVM